jgi:hypothetical protein
VADLQGELVQAQSKVKEMEIEIQSKDSQIQSWKEQVKCVYGAFVFVFVCVPANVDACCRCAFV